MTEEEEEEDRGIGHSSSLMLYTAMICEHIETMQNYLFQNNKLEHFISFYNQFGF